MQGCGGHLQLHPNIAGIVAEKEEDKLEHDDNSLQKEVTNFPISKSNVPTPESNKLFPFPQIEVLTSL